MRLPNSYYEKKKTHAEPSNCMMYIFFVEKWDNATSNFSLLHDKYTLKKDNLKFVFITVKVQLAKHLFRESENTKYKLEFC